MLSFPLSHVLEIGQMSWFTVINWDCLIGGPIGVVGDESDNHELVILGPQV